MTTEPHIPLGSACVVRFTGPTGLVYLGKTKQRLNHYLKTILRLRQTPFGVALHNYGRDSFRFEIVLVGTEEYCHDMKERLIEAEGTLAPDGYNVAPKSRGFTSEEALRVAELPQTKAWGKSPEAREIGVRLGEVMARRAGYPQRRVLVALEAAPQGLTVAMLVASLGLTEARVRSAIISLRRQGHNIIATGRVFILFTNEEDVSSAISVRHAAYSTHRVLAALRDAPLGLTLAMLAADLGLSQVQVQTAIHNLRLHHGHNIENQGGKQGPGGRPGTFHLVTEPAPPAS